MLGRYWLWFDGSTPPRIPVAKPIEKPPRVAGIGRFSPPSTTPASTKIVSGETERARDLGLSTLSITAATAAKSPETTTAPAITRVRADTEQPRRPKVHRRRAHVQAEQMSA